MKSIESRVKLAAELFLRHADDVLERRVMLRDDEVQVNVVLVRSAPSDGTRLLCSNFLDREHSQAVPGYEQFRQILETHKQLAERLAAMKKKNDWHFKVVFDILKPLMEPPPGPPKEPIGFAPPRKN